MRSPEERALSLQRMAQRFPVFNTLTVADADGVLLPPAPPSVQEAVNVDDRAYFQRLRADPDTGLQISQPVISRATGLPVVVLARRLNDVHGRFDGAAIASIALPRLVAAFESTARKPSDEFTVRDASGRLIVRANSWGVTQADPAALPASAAQAPLPAADDPVRARRHSQTYNVTLEVSMAPDEHRASMRSEALLLALVWCACTAGSLTMVARVLRERRRQEADERALRDSENRFRSFFDHALIGMAVISPSREWLLVNPALSELLGRSAAEVLATPVFDIVAPVFADAASSELGEIFAGRSGGVVVESGLTRADGSTVDVLVSLRSFDGEGASGLLAMCVQDISQRKAGERRATQALALIQRFIDHFPGAAYLKDEQLRVVLANRGLQTLLGLDPATVAGKSNAEVYPGAFGDKLDADDRRVLETGQSEVIEERFGAQFYETHKFRVMGADDHPMLGGLTMDVTLRHREAERVAAMLELSGRDASMDEREFVARALGVAERLTCSHIGFLHYINADQETIELVTWTAGALRGCSAAHDTHYPISQAGVWANAFRTRSAVVINDYPGLPAKHGMPPGHAPLQRMVCVPVIEDDGVRMLLGVGNADGDYDEHAVATLQLLGNDIWRHVRHLRADVALKQRIAELDALNQQLTAAQGQLLQSEKMASIGQLAAGVAHEINNPIGFVHSNLGTLAEYVQELLLVLDLCMRCARQHLAPPEMRLLDEAWREHDIDYLRQDIQQLLAESRDGANRVRVIVKNLRDLVHVSGDELVWADLREGLDSTLNVVWNEIKYKANVTKEYAEIPRILCVPAQINQVFMNLLVNAVQAIDTRGEIHVRTGSNEHEVWVEIEDSGRGISPEHFSRIFEPFFTTKPVGQGTGLGLSVSHGIVTKHRGRITVCSQQGEGTCFRVALPRMATEANGSDVPGAPARASVAAISIDALEQ
jgi:PAS domain S-box-containing protein